ncbi:MAG: hypothetical protein Q8T08_07360 [Ignavibacteria bacterium]|nr:hypothetical protein [Ignavibacteria bacterium]
MKKIILFSFLLTVIFSVNNSAQYQIEKHYFGPSLGLSFLGSVPQIGFNYEYGLNVKDFGDIGVGGILRYWAHNEGFFGGEWSYTNFLLGAQGNYHFKINNPKVDLWGGLVLALQTGSVEYKGSNANIYVKPSYGGLWMALQGGCRYWMSSDFALVGRLGLGTLSYSSLEFGVDWKF